MGFLLPLLWWELCVCPLPLIPGSLFLSVLHFCHTSFSWRPLDVWDFKFKLYQAWHFWNLFFWRGGGVVSVDPFLLFVLICPLPISPSLHLAAAT